MKKALVLVAALVGLAVVAKPFGSKMQNVDWEKKFERMPDNAPPKWMFRNITAIRVDRGMVWLGERTAYG